MKEFGNGIDGSATEATPQNGDPGNTVQALFARQNARDEQEARLLEALLKFEAVAASTAVEFGRIDLALTRMEGIERELSATKTELTTVARNVQKRDAWSIALNFVGATIYVLLGALITLLAEHLAGKWHLL
jgi:choline dehydrogenase-like flavoprotein